MEGDQAKQLQDAAQQLQQLEAASTHLSQQLQEEQHQRAAADTRCTELDGELLHVRELVMLLGKSLGKLPSGQALPAHDDPVWQKPGPLGGVAHTLDVAMRAVRVSGAWPFVSERSVAFCVSLNCPCCVIGTGPIPVVPFHVDTCMCMCCCCVVVPHAGPASTLEGAAGGLRPAAGQRAG